MKYTILHITDPHWICYNDIDVILAGIRAKTGDESKVREAQYKIKQEIFNYKYIAPAFKNTSLAHHFTSKNGEKTFSILAHTGDFANFHGYHGHLDIKRQLSHIANDFLPLIEDAHVPFDLKVTVPGNHDYDRNCASPAHEDRFKEFYALFENRGWKTPLTEESVRIGPKFNQIRFWLLNSCKKCGDRTVAEDGVTVKKDDIQIDADDEKRWEQSLESDETMRIALIHHSPVPNNSHVDKRDVFTNNRDFNGALLRTNVKLVLSGHHHVGDELYASMPSHFLKKGRGVEEPMMVSPIIESGFLSLSAPTFLRLPSAAGMSQGFNVVEIDLEPGNNIASITVTKYRFTSESNDHKFTIPEPPLQYRVAMKRLHQFFSERREQDRRLKVLASVVRDIYSPTTPIEPLERILKIRNDDERTGKDIEDLIEEFQREGQNIFALYGVAVLSPAAWWAKEITRRFRMVFFDNINRAIVRGGGYKKGRLTALFPFSNSLFAAITCALTGAEKLKVVNLARAMVEAELLFNHEERVWINAIFRGKPENKTRGSLSKWAREEYDQGIEGRGGRINIDFKLGGWEIPSGHEKKAKNHNKSLFETARIACWPLEDFDTDYALRVIEFHEDFCVPLFWLNPETLNGRNGERRKKIGSLVICKHETAYPPDCKWNNARGERPKPDELYSKGLSRDEDGKMNAQIWGSKAYPACLKNSLDSGSAEVKALLRRPDILFASDVWALRKMNQTKLLEGFLDDKKEACKLWLES